MTVFNSRTVRAWRCLFTVVLALAAGGCGSNSSGGGGGGGGAVTGTPIATTRAVPALAAAGTTYKIETGDDYVLVLSSTDDPTGDATVTVNGGTTDLAKLAEQPNVNRGRAAHGLLDKLPPPSGADRSRQVTDPALGSTRVFSVVQGSSPTVTATLQRKTAHGLLYVDNGTAAGAFTAANMDDVIGEFETHIYATDTAAFGPVSDVDGNGRVILLMTPTIRAGGYGYFYPGDVIGGGNQADMLYVLTPDPAAGDPYTSLRPGIMATVAHELQHLINYNAKALVNHTAGEESWLNEALSFNAEQLNGWQDSQGGSPRNSYLYFASPEWFTLLERSGSYKHAHAGLGYMFVRYLADRFGATMFHTLVQNGLTGEDNVATSTGVPFATLVQDVGATLYLAHTGLSSDAKYALPSFDTHGTFAVQAVTLHGPTQTRVSAATGHPAFRASWARGGYRYLRLTNVPAGGAQFAFTSGQSGVRATVIRVPTSAP